MASRSAPLALDPAEPDGIRYINEGVEYAGDGTAFGPAGPSEAGEHPDTPKPILDLDDELLQRLTIWVDFRLRAMINEHDEKMKQWKELEEDYRARGEESKSFPFDGACGDEMPVQAMAVDPIHARLDTGIFKQDPVVRVKGLKRSVLKYATPLEQWIDFNIKHRWHFRKVASPRMLEFAKLGLMVFKTTYERHERQVIGYDPDADFKVVEKTQLTYEGPKIKGISIGDFFYPADFEEVQDCPIVAERIRTTFWKLKKMERAGQLANVDMLRAQERDEKTILETEREAVENHPDLRMWREDLVLYEVWFDYDVKGNDLPTPMIGLYHLPTRTFVRLQYNYYFNQKKQFVAIPYTVVNGSIGGLGIGEMIHPFQTAITRWQQMASDNAYLANIRMFIAKRDCGIEDVPRLYAGRTFFVDDPSRDFIPFRAADIYPSTLSERQNLFGMVEKRTGVSDYLTGRESPIIGTRATATSTIALIQEGTKRVEQVLENIRQGFSEIIQNCMDIWIQFGLGDLDELVFGDDDSGQLVKEFFTQIATKQNVNGLIAFDLSATDATGSRQVQQQMQLSIIQVMMGYLEKLLQAGSEAIQAQQAAPEFSLMVVDVMNAARKMFKELLQKYDIRNPEDYLPDLEKYIHAQPVNGQGGGQVPPGGPGGPGAAPGLPASSGANVGGPPGGPQPVGTSIGPTDGITLAGPDRRIAANVDGLG